MLVNKKSNYTHIKLFGLEKLNIFANTIFNLHQTIVEVLHRAHKACVQTLETTTSPPERPCT